MVADETVAAHTSRRCDWDPGLACARQGMASLFLDGVMRIDLRSVLQGRAGPARHDGGVFVDKDGTLLEDVAVSTVDPARAALRASGAPRRPCGVPLL
jgi:hypothetical protein